MAKNKGKDQARCQRHPGIMYKAGDQITYKGNGRNGQCIRQLRRHMIDMDALGTGR